VAAGGLCVYVRLFLLSNLELRCAGPCTTNYIPTLLGLEEYIGNHSSSNKDTQFSCMFEEKTYTYEQNYQSRSSSAYLAAPPMWCGR
jgi:hypothetical protein